MSHGSSLLCKRWEKQAAASAVPRWRGAMRQDLTFSCFMTKEGRVGFAGVPLGIKATVLPDSSLLFSINLIIFWPLHVNHPFVSRAPGAVVVQKGQPVNLPQALNNKAKVDPEMMLFCCS